MAEIRRQDVWDERVIQAPLEYTANLGKAIEATDKLIAIMKQSQANISASKTVNGVAKETRNLSAAEKELNKIQKQVSTAQARNTAEYQKQNKELISLREAQRKKNQETKNELLITRSLGGEYKKLTTQLDRARQKYKDLAASGRASNKELLRQQNIVQNLNKKVGTIDKSVGQFQRNVGNYPGTFNAAATGVRNFAAAFGLVGGLFLFAKLLKGVVSLTADYERQNSTLKAVLGATGTQMRELRADQLELGKSTEFTSTQVTQLQTEFAKLGFPTKDIRDMTASTLDAALAMGSDLGAQAALTGATLKAFKLPATEAQRVNDVLAKSTSASALNFEKLNNSMSTVAPVAAKFGFSIESTVALLGELSNAGFDASSGATATRNILLNLADSNGKLAKSLKEPVKDLPSLVRGLKQLNSEGVDLGEALELTDKRSVAAFATFLSGTDAVLELNDKLENANGTAKSMAVTMGDNLTGDTKKFQSAFEGLVLSITNGDSLFSRILRTILQLGAAFLNFLTPQKTLTDQLKEERTELNVLVKQLRFYNDDQKKRSELIATINKEYPDFLKGLDTEKASYEDIASRLMEVNKQYEKKILLQATQDQVISIQKQIAEEQLNIEKSLQKQVELEEKLPGADDLKAGASGLSSKASLELAISGQKGLQVQAEERIAALQKEQNTLLTIQAKQISEFGNLIEEDPDSAETEVTKAIKEQETAFEDLLNAAKAATLGKTLGAREELKLLKAVALIERNIALSKATSTSEKELIEAQYLEKIGNLNIKFYDEELKRSQASVDARNKHFRDGYDQDVKDHEEAEKKKTEDEKKQEEERLQHLRDTFSLISQLYNGLSSSIQDISNGLTSRRIQNLENELKVFDETTQRQIELAGDNDAAVQRIEENAEARRKAKELQIKREQRRQAQINKAAAIINTIVNTAVAITNALSTVTPYPAAVIAAISAGVLGTAQTAAVAAQPIPQFAKGTEAAPGGAAIVGEQGREIIRELSGKTYLTPDRSSIMNVPKGAEVIPHDETMRMLALSSIGQEHYTQQQNAELIGEIKELKKVSGNIVKAIYANGGHLEADGSILMRVRKDEQGNRERIRKSSMT